MSESITNQDALSASIVRQPVFDRDGKLWGYELSCVESSNPSIDSAACLVSSAYASLQKILQGGKKIIVDFSEKSILDNLPYVLPPVSAAIKIDDQFCARESNIQALARLKQDGYRIAIQGFSGDAERNPIYKLADIIAIDAKEGTVDSLQPLIAAARNFNALLFAAGVLDRRLYELCRNLGFALFCGPFFKYPEKISARKLSSNQALRLNLLKLIERENPDIALLAEAIQSDATISYRLLAFINSAGFSFPNAIKSIHQAITLLGWSKIKNWLRVVLLTDMNQSKEAEELVLLSAQRGLFLELVARDHDFWGFDPENLHLLGIFSLLDALIGMPMEEIVEHLPIDGKMKGALKGVDNNEYRPLLLLAQSLEEARWADADFQMQQLNLDREKVMAAFRKSIEWAGGLETMSSKNASAGEQS